MNKFKRGTQVTAQTIRKKETISAKVLRTKPTARGDFVVCRPLDGRPDFATRPSLVTAAG